VKYKAWELEESYVLVRALEARLAPIGYHVAIIDGVKTRKTELELAVYPNVTPRDREHIASLLYATEMRLVSRKMLAKPRQFGVATLAARDIWSHGKGKNARRVSVFLQMG
jgi:hypothetical protein